MGRKPKVIYSAKDINPQMSLMPELDFQYVDRSVARVKQAWEMHKFLGSGKPMLLAFSGGKDSVCVYGVCKKASEELGVPFDEMFYMQYNITNVDPPELVKFVRDEFPQVHMHHPEKTMWQLIVEHHMPPTRMVRFCCQKLKEVSNEPNCFTLTGVRHAESSKRADRGGLEIIGDATHPRIKLNDNENRNSTEYCIQNRSYVCNPIIEWSDEDVWNFIRHENLPYCKLYDEGFSRLGCIGCPMAQNSDREAQFKRWPGYEKQYIRTFQKMLDTNGCKLKIPMIDGQDVMDAWMYRPSFRERHKDDVHLGNENLFLE